MKGGTKMDINLGNTSSLRLLNLYKVVSLLYQAGSMTQAQIKTESGLSGPTVIQCIQHFKEKGAFYEGKALASSGGRKPTLICFDYNYRYAVGVEIRRHHVDISIMNLKGECIATRTERLIFEQSREHLQAIGRIIDELIAQNVDPKKVLGIMVAFPGEVSLDRSEITRSTIFGMHSVNLDRFKKEFRYPIMIENGANAAGFGAVFKDKNLADTVYIVVTDNGIAGSVVINKKVYRGNSGKAGAFGHIQLDSNGRQCSCGQKGCWSVCCSVASLTGDEDTNLKDFFARVDNHDEEAVNALDQYIKYMAQGIACAHLAFDTDVMIGGKIVPYLEKYQDQLRKAVFEYSVLKDESFNINLDLTSNSPMSEGAALMIVADYMENGIFTE